MTYTGHFTGHKVTREIKLANAKLPNYPLLPGDLVVEREDGTFGKFAPGLGIEGFVLTDEQKATLEPVEDVPFAIGSLTDFAASLGRRAA